MAVKKLVKENDIEAMDSLNKAAGLDDTAGLVDHLGLLQAKIASFEKELKPLIKQANDIKKELQARADAEFPPDQDAFFSGNAYAATLGPKAEHREITDMSEVVKLMGAATFLKVAKVTLTDIDKYLNPVEQESCVSKARTGLRSLKITGA